MSQESDCSTCSQLSISQETMDLMWKSMSDLTNICAYTQIAARDQARSADVQFTVDDGDATLLIDKFQIARGSVTTSSQPTIDSQQIFTDQCNTVANACTTAILEASKFDEGDRNQGNSDEQLGNVLQSININTMQPLPAFPSNVPFGGEYGFEMSLTMQSKETKAVDWTYSELLRKVFVRFGQPCPFRFRTTVCPPIGTRLRAMPIYTRPQHIQEVVKRCPHHAAKTASENIGTTAPASHLVRCEHKLARYDEDSYTGFHSVVVPYDHPPAGLEWTIYLYQFMCFSSCIGGLNRRPVQIVFSLETVDGRTLGRQAIEVRICACPGRDRQTEEKNSGQSVTSAEPGEKLAVTSEIMTVGPPAKRRRVEDEEIFTITVRGRDNYEILHRLRDSLEVASAIPQTQFEKLKRRQEELRKNPASSQSVSVYSSCSSNSCSSPGGVAAADTAANETVVHQSSGCCHNTDVKLEVNETTIDSWLTRHGLSACASAFRVHNVTSAQLQHMSLEDLEKIGLRDDLLAAIWLAISRERKLASSAPVVGVQSTRPTAGSQPAAVASSAGDAERQAGDVFEVTRYTFKRMLSLPKEKRALDQE